MEHVTGHTWRELRRVLPALQRTLLAGGSQQAKCVCVGGVMCVKCAVLSVWFDVWMSAAAYWACCLPVVLLPSYCLLLLLPVGVSSINSER